MASYEESKIPIYIYGKLLQKVIRTDLAAFFAQGVFVKQVLCHAVLRSSHAAQVGHPVCQFFDGLHLLIQVVCLNEITQLKERESLIKLESGNSLTEFN